MDWNTDDVLTFIRLYEREPTIWNPSCPEYKNRFRLQEAWKRIADGLGGKFSVDDLKAKKLSLMASYRKLAIKVRSGTDPDWRPEWFAFSAMDRFLKDIYEPKSERNAQRIEESHLQEELSATYQEPAGDYNSSGEEELGREENAYNGVSAVQISNPTNFLEVRVDEAGRQGMVPDSSRPQRSENSLSHIRSLFEKPEPDECSLYGEFVAKKLRSMDEETRDLAMLEVHGLLYRMKRKNAKSMKEERMRSPILNHLGLQSEVGNI